MIPLVKRSGVVASELLYGRIDTAVSCVLIDDRPEKIKERDVEAKGVQEALSREVSLRNLPARNVLQF